MVVTVGYDGMHDMIFETFDMVDGELLFLETYWVTEETGEVSGSKSGYCGILFD